MHELWAISAEAELFVDVDYSQWGLRLLSPAASTARTARQRRDRPEDSRAGDIVIGEFLGDQDLLVVDEIGDVLVAMPLDHRADWYRPASDLADFLDRYVAGAGAKFWEAGPSDSPPVRSAA